MGEGFTGNLGVGVDRGVVVVDYDYFGVGWGVLRGYGLFCGWLDFIDLSVLIIPI